MLYNPLRHGLTAVGRYPGIPLPPADHLGSEARLLDDLGANVLEVGNERLRPRLHVEEADVVLRSRPAGPSTTRK